MVVPIALLIVFVCSNVIGKRSEVSLTRRAVRRIALRRYVADDAEQSSHGFHVRIRFGVLLTSGKVRGRGGCGVGPNPVRVPLGFSGWGRGGVEGRLLGLGSKVLWVRRRGRVAFVRERRKGRGWWGGGLVVVTDAVEIEGRSWCSGSSGVRGRVGGGWEVEGGVGWWLDWARVESISNNTPP
ncbi:hypothetical protein Acr_07g0003150 [Actinidia rufa]|uniref:Secreted protein n=1 Tax=Actinidia rufa TaxID=165716 RepID=A0A7J0EUQ8_9ERIC|nr:hypothetical protein Acr_07g0003150 [Actinidia rufa]